MSTQTNTSPAAQSAVQAQTQNQGVKNMKKAIVKLAIATVIATSTLIINPSTAQAQSVFSSQGKYDSSFLTVRNDEDWDGGLTVKNDEDWDGGLTVKNDEDWDGGFINIESKGPLVL